MNGELSLEEIWIRKKERTLAWLRLGFSIVAILVVHLDPDKVARDPALYQLARYSFATYSLLVLLLAYRFASSGSIKLGIFTTCFDLFFVSLIDYAGGPGTPFFVYYLFPVITASSRYGTKGSVIVALIGIAVYGVMRFSPIWGSSMELDTFVVRCIYLFALAYMFGFLSEFEKKQNQRLMALNNTARDATINEERRKLAHELHDRLLQALASLGMRLEACRKHLIRDPSGLAAELELMEQAARDSMKEIRAFLNGKGSDSFVPGTLLEKIKDEMKFLRDGMGLRMVLENEPEDLNFPVAVEKELYLVMREALLNVALHSHASEAIVSLEAAGREIRGSLLDDGIGFSVDAPKRDNGYGLNIMEERIRKLGGRFFVASIPGKGTKISFVVPLPG
jgi:signal transduction histidine kinase